MVIENEEEDKKTNNLKKDFIFDQIEITRESQRLSYHQQQYSKNVNSFD